MVCCNRTWSYCSEIKLEGTFYLVLYAWESIRHHTAIPCDKGVHTKSSQVYLGYYQLITDMAFNATYNSWMSVHRCNVHGVWKMSNHSQRSFYWISNSFSLFHNLKGCTTLVVTISFYVCQRNFVINLFPGPHFEYWIQRKSGLTSIHYAGRSKL